MYHFTMYESQEILELGKKVSKKTGYTLKTIGRKAIGDARVFDRIMNGGECFPRTYTKLGDWLKGQLEG